MDARIFIETIHGRTVQDVSSFAEASAAVRAITDDPIQLVGSSGFYGATVVDNTTGRPLAVVSYNGRVWDREVPMDEWMRGVRPVELTD